MNQNIIFFIFTMLVCASCSHHIITPSQLELKPIGLNEGFFSWQRMGASFGYQITLDSSEIVNKSIPYLLEVDPNAKQTSFGAITYILPGQLSGDSITISALIKTDSSEYTGLWCRQDLRYGVYKGFYNMSDRPIKGTTDWKQYSITLALDQGINEIHFGGLQIGKGKSWFNNFQVNIDGKLVKIKRKLFNSLKKEPTPKQLSWLDKNNQSFTLSDYKSYTFLDDLIVDKRIVMIGEQTHSGAEFQQFRNNAVKYLAVNHGFSMIGYEQGAAGGSMNDFVVNEKIPINPERIKYNFRSKIYRSKENIDFILWLRENLANKINFYGLDRQDPSKIFRALNFVSYQRFPEVEYRSNRLQMLTKGKDFEYVSENFRTSFTREVDSLAKIIKNLPEQDDNYFLDQAKYLIRAVQHECIYTKSKGNQHLIDRDSLMAANIFYLLKKYPEKKIVILAHNVHIGNYHYTFGEILKKKIPNELLSIGTATASGLYGSFDRNWENFTPDRKLNPAPIESYEYYFSKAKDPNFILDIRKANSQNNGSWLRDPRFFRTIGAWEEFHQFYYCPEGLPHLFDVIAFFQETGAIEVAE